MKLMKFVLMAGAAILGMTNIAGECNAERYDLALVNARIWTGDPVKPNARVALIRDGVFVFIGDEAPADFEADRTIDAHGQRVLPGLIDTHVHLSGAAEGLAILDLRGAESREALLDRVRTSAGELERDEWLIGRGWSAESWPDQRPPTAEEVDEAAGGRRALLTRMDGHSLIASRSALEYAGIDVDGPENPAGGKIERDGAGVPTGAIFEQAMSILYSRVPRRDEGTLRELVARAAHHANSLGVTQVGSIDPRGVVEGLFVDLDQSGELTLRCAVTVAGSVDHIDEWKPILEWASANPKLSGRVHIVGFKAYMDGSLGSRTAWQLAPYLDNPSELENAGFPLAMAADGTLPKLIRLGASMGLQPAVHAIGDRANRMLLDWYEQEMSASERRKLRPRVEHAQHLSREDIARFAHLNVIPSMQPYHKADDGRYAERRLGSQRIKTSYAFRDLVDSGAQLAFGSDWPVVSVNPFLGIHAAVTARTLDDEIFVPSQSITVEEALRAYTSVAAYCLHSEDFTGRISPGYAADLIVLDRDILAIDPELIDETRVLTTIVGGDVVFEAR